MNQVTDLSASFLQRISHWAVEPEWTTSEYMHEHYVQFQSALAMLDRMYDDLDLGVAYRETERVQS